MGFIWGFIKFAFKLGLRLLLVTVIVIVATLAYTEYAKTFGIVKFQEGGYLVFDAPKDMYLPMRAGTSNRLINSIMNYKAIEGLVDKSCDLDCARAGHDSGSLVVGTFGAEMAQYMGTCGQSKDITSWLNEEGTPNKPTIMCQNGSATSAIFDLGNSKKVGIIMASRDINFITSHRKQVIEIVNSAKYENDNWFSLSFLEKYLR